MRSGRARADRPDQRPVVILQDDRFDSTESVTVCALTTSGTEAPLFRRSIEPNERNGLEMASQLMVDEITTVRRSRLGSLIGQISDEDMVRLNWAVLVFLGFASSSRSAPAE